MTKNYWEKETPREINTGKQIIRYYQEAGKLQISNPPRMSPQGEERPGKALTLCIDTLLEGNPEAMAAARGTFADIVQRIDSRLELRQ